LEGAAGGLAAMNFIIMTPQPYEKEGATMYQVSIYAITPNLWRWEIRSGGVLLRCGTAPTWVAADSDVNHVVNT
jgi:hypothetical protein